MESVLAFFKNKWTKFGFSFISPLYVAFFVWLTWLSFTHFIRPTNPTSLFALYLLINILFGVAMIYTRKQIFTHISACLLHPIGLALLLINYGNWYLIVPPIAVATIVFFVARSGETLKTVLGTIYLILYVVGVIGYLTLQTFSIEIWDVDMELRSDEYLYSPGRTYRVVQYIDPPEKENRTVKFYIERGDFDKHYWFVDCENVDSGKIILTSRYSKLPQVKWVDDDRLLIDGKITNVSNPHDDDEDEFSGETAIITLPPETTIETDTSDEEEE